MGRGQTQGDSSRGWIRLLGEGQVANEINLRYTRIQNLNSRTNINSHINSSENPISKQITSYRPPLDEIIQNEVGLKIKVNNTNRL